MAVSSSGLKSPYAFLEDERLEGANEMGRLIRARDWSDSLGPIEGWPTSLGTTVGLMLRSPVPLVLLWGSDGIMLYNDAYGEFAGNRHPGLLGKKVLEGWPEATDLNGLIAAAAKDLADYQRLTAEGKLGEAGQKLEALKQKLDALNRQRR